MVVRNQFGGCFDTFNLNHVIHFVRQRCWTQSNSGIMFPQSCVQDLGSCSLRTVLSVLKDSPFCIIPRTPVAAYQNGSFAIQRKLLPPCLRENLFVHVRADSSLKLCFIIWVSNLWCFTKLATPKPLVSPLKITLFR